MRYMKSMQGLRDNAEFRMVRRALHGGQARVIQIDSLVPRSKLFLS